MGVWGLMGNQTGTGGVGIGTERAIIYGYTLVPSNVDPDSVGKIDISIGGNVTGGSISSFVVGVCEIQTGQTFNFLTASIILADSQFFTAPSTAWARKELSFTLTSATTADAILGVVLQRINTGLSSTSVNCTSTLFLFDAFLTITATA